MTVRPPGPGWPPNHSNLIITARDHAAGENANFAGMFTMELVLAVLVKRGLCGAADGNVRPVRAGIRAEPQGRDTAEVLLRDLQACRLGGAQEARNGDSTLQDLEPIPAWERPMLAPMDGSERLTPEPSSTPRFE
jgi:hypothetical protein